MIDRLGEGAVHDAEILRYGRCMGKKFTNVNTTIVVLLFGKLVFGRANGQCLLSCGHASDALAIAHVLGQVLSEHFLHLGFVVPQIVMAGTAAHEEVDDTLGLSGMMGAWAGGA